MRIAVAAAKKESKGRNVSSGIACPATRTKRVHREESRPVSGYFERNSPKGKKIIFGDVEKIWYQRRHPSTEDADPDMDEVQVPGNDRDDDDDDGLWKKWTLLSLRRKCAEFWRGEKNAILRAATA
jgi:hypothetical protein